MSKTKLQVNTMKVESGIPLVHKQLACKRQYPFDTMSIGDSFTVSTDKTRATRMAAIRYKNSTNKDFRITTRTVVENKQKLIRVWRVA